MAILIGGPHASVGSCVVDLNVAFGSYSAIILADLVRCVRLRVALLVLVVVLLGIVHYHASNP